jgi:large subunit ribosomal protein L24
MASGAQVKRSPPKLNVRSGDEVEVIAGKDRGKRGKVLRVDRRGERVYVEGLNMVKRHMRPQQVRDGQGERAIGGVIEREGPIHVSNVMVLDPKDGKPTRIGSELEGGRRFRIARRSGTRID